MLEFLQPRVHIRIGPERFWMRAPRRNLTIDEPPWVAISAPPKRRILAFGGEALAMRAHAGVTVVNPFDHPRTPIGDFALADQLVKHYLRKLGNRWYAAAPVVILSVDVEPEGGLTDVEMRALQEMAMGAGASRAITWSGPRLSDEQIARLDFPTTGEVLHTLWDPPRR